jgi:hypothetical protein
MMESVQIVSLFYTKTIEKEGENKKNSEKTSFKYVKNNKQLYEAKVQKKRGGDIHLPLFFVSNY